MRTNADEFGNRNVTLRSPQWLRVPEHLPQFPHSLCIERTGLQCTPHLAVALVRLNRINSYPAGPDQYFSFYFLFAFRVGAFQQSAICMTTRSQSDR